MSEKIKKSVDCIFIFLMIFLINYLLILNGEINLFLFISRWVRYWVSFQQIYLFLAFSNRGLSYKWSAQAHTSGSQLRGFYHLQNPPPVLSALLSSYLFPGTNLSCSLGCSYVWGSYHRSSYSHVQLYCFML